MTTPFDSAKRIAMCSRTTAPSQINETVTLSMTSDYRIHDSGACRRPTRRPKRTPEPFCSGELGTRWTFVVRNGELVLLRDRHADEPLMQIFRGTFRENDAFLFFHKNGFTARNTTLRSVDFQRCR
jgi:hypothetical protein